ncbi:MAG: hypothetical protein JOZ49_14500, partial [Mycolicibacterium sp.]|nr:hypothetical protein [Mycolicibacterium sp.]
ETTEFVDAEKQALKDLQGLRRTLSWASGPDRSLYAGAELAHLPKSTRVDSGLYRLLVDRIIDDTEHHIKILEFIRDRLSASAALPAAKPVSTGPVCTATTENAHQTAEPIVRVEDHHAETCRGVYDADPLDVLNTAEMPDCKTSFEWGEASAINPMPAPTSPRASSTSE